jgi:hypothetical protein
VRDVAELLPDQEVGDDRPEGGSPADILNDDDGLLVKPAEGLTIESEVTT